MPKIQLEKSTQLSPQECFKRVKNFIENDKDLRKLDSGYKCQFDENRFCASAKGSKFEATIQVLDSSPCKVEVVIQLPFLLSPFKGFVEKILRSKLDALEG